MDSPLVVVVAYRSDEHLQRCLEAIGGSLEVLVVDNDASPTTEDVCVTYAATYLPTAENLGFAGAVNLGLARAGGRDVLLLNPDARISAEAVLTLQRFLHDPAHHRAAVGPQLVGPDGDPEPASWPMPSPVQVWADAVGLSPLLRTRFVTGAVLLLRAEAVAEVGGFDERYFLYAEESDWQRRATRAGWEVAVHPQVTADHVGGASSSDSDRRDYHFITSNRAFARRWYGSAGARVMRAGAVVAAARRTVVGPDRQAGRRRLGQSINLPAPSGHVPRPSVVHVVCTDAFAGVERSVVDLATEQHRRGWRVTVIGGDQQRMRAELPPGVLALPGPSVARAYRALRRIGHADVVHAHMTAAELAAAAAKSGTGGRLVSTRHFAATRGSSPWAQLAGRIAAARIDAQIAISEFVAAAVEGPTEVVQNGVRPSTGPRRRTRSVVVLQRLEAEKQTELAIRAWAASGLAEQGWTMSIYGRGAQRAELERLAAQLSIADSVTFAGFTDEPRSVLAAASILLATAPAEPFGLTVAEAMAEATPVVAADGGAHREVLGPSGHYFAPGDVRAAASELVRLATMEETARRALGEQLRERQASRFTVEAQVTRLLASYRGHPGMRVALVSLEPWDEVWRRNQHLSSRLVRSGVISSLLFVTPPSGGWAARATRARPQPGIEVVTPPLVMPRRYGGHRMLARWLRREAKGVELWWVNDPVAGDASRPRGEPTVYDVTDDWRELDQPAADRRRIVAAEDRLATTAETVVCSPSLATRWRDRYGVAATLVGNGVDVAAIRAARPLALPGNGPHVVYVGTVHPNRVDVSLLRDLANGVDGTLHLVGPDSLDDGTRTYLLARGARCHGRVPSSEVPGWLTAADVLVCPHLVNDFTLSLDAIKAYEYLATRVPVVATPSSGFEALHAPGLTVVPAGEFVAAVAAATGTGPFDREPPPDWDQRAVELADVLRATLHGTTGVPLSRSSFSR